MTVIYSNYGYDLVLLSDNTLGISQEGKLLSRTGIRYTSTMTYFMLDFILYDYIEDEREREELEGYFN